MELHKDAIKPGQKVVLIDDLLATGGTMEANIKPCGNAWAVKLLRLIFLIELAGLCGRERLKAMSRFCDHLSR